MLDPKVHERLIKDLPGVCSRAGVHKHWLNESATTVCGPTELDWLVHFRQSAMPGLKIVGPNALNRCMAVCAALIRNYVDARIRTFDQMVDDPVEATVLICPNFYVAGSSQPKWRVQKVYDQLVERFGQERPTVVWVESDLGVKEYGEQMFDLLSTYRRAAP